MEKQLNIYDLETYPNFFLAVFKCIVTGDYRYFEISDRKTDQINLKKFLNEQVKGLIGFNNLNFDYPVLHNTILKSNKLLTAQEIYKEVETIINTKYSAIWDNQIKIPQLDLYRIWHYDNKNKSTSLKWLEFAMKLPNVEDLPYKPGTILTFDQMDEIISYCKNDIEATEKFYNLSSKHIEIRKFYTQLEGINLINASEIKMSKEIFGKYLSKEMSIDTKILSKLRTERSEVNIKDIIFDYLKFNDLLNQEVLDKFNSYKWIDTSNMSKEQAKKYSISFSRPYKNVIREYAEGGLHSFGKAGIYESDDDYILVDVDFASYYPHISFRNKLHPEHIPEPIFSRIYEGFYKDRKLYDKKDPRNYVLKIILNGSYGLSKDKYAFLYDPKWQLAICINGQLMLTLLTEKVFEACNVEPTIIFENTDGAMYRIHKSDYDNLTKACKEVEEIVNIPLEVQVCKKIIARDVNNYINIITDENIKFKGCFEIDRDYHKNHSKRIVSIALGEYFINNRSIEDTIFKHLNVVNTNSNSVSNISIDNECNSSFYENYGIYDFCLGAKMKGQNELVQRESAGKLKIFTEEFKREYMKPYEWYGNTWKMPHWEDMGADGDLDRAFRAAYRYNGNTLYETKPIDTPLSKMNRYYVSNIGVELIKKLPPLEKHFLTETDKYKLKVDKNQLNIFDIIDDVKIDAENRDENLEAGYKCTLFNKYKEYNYDLNYNYYINECYSIINKLK